MTAKYEAERIADLIFSQNIPRAVFVTATGRVKTMNTHGAHWAGAQDDPARMKYLVGIYDERASVQDIIDDIEFKPA